MKTIVDKQASKMANQEIDIMKMTFDEIQTKLEELTSKLKSKEIENHELKQEIISKEKESTNIKHSKEPNLDEITHWIINPGLNYIAQNIFSCLDTKTLVQSREVSRTWKSFIDNNKTLLLIQIDQLRKFKFIEPIYHTRTKTQVTYFEWCDFVYKSYRGSGQPPVHGACKKVLLEWEKAFEFMKNENLGAIKKFHHYFKSKFTDKEKRSVGWMKPAKILALEFGMKNTFEKLLSLYKFTEKDFWALKMENYFDPQTMVFVLEHMKRTNVNINKLEIPFEAYSNVNHSYEMLEILLQRWEEFGINFNKKDYNGVTLIDIVKENKDEEIIELIGQYNIKPNSRKRKRS